MTQECFIRNFISRALNIAKFQSYTHNKFMDCRDIPCDECQYAYKDEHNDTRCFILAYRDQYMPDAESSVAICKEIINLVRKFYHIEYKEIDL